MGYKERILDYLWSVAPGGATNGQIARALGISSQQTVYMTTQELAGRRLIRAAKEGATWVFYTLDTQADGGAVRASTASTARAGTLTPMTFEALAGRILGEYYRTPLAPGVVAGIRKRFDFVSADAQIVGAAKYDTLVRGERLPPAKFATIAEHVWLLEKTNAPTQFLVFGHDREVPVRWLERYGPLAGSVQFFFLSDEGHLEVLQ
ncbi:MAG: helix-turn-helix transcriptional regulator [Blastochloris sp.]|nr:helix-turn-helix transcriptional regulator [Blastochloris sp.]